MHDDAIGTVLAELGTDVDAVAKDVDLAAERPAGAGPAVSMACPGSQVLTGSGVLSPGGFRRRGSDPIASLMATIDCG